MHAVHIHQILTPFISRQELDPGFEVLDNLANERPDWYEYWPMRRFLLNEQSLRDDPDTRYPNNPFSALAPRELEILHYVLKGLGTKEIAQTLNVKMNTVSTVKNRIFEKTLTTNLKELIELATLYNVNY